MAPMMDVLSFEEPIGSLSQVYESLVPHKLNVICGVICGVMNNCGVICGVMNRCGVICGVMDKIGMIKSRDG